MIPTSDLQICLSAERQQYENLVEKVKLNPFKSTADVVLIKHAGSPDNKQTISLAVNPVYCVLIIATAM